ncbi:class II fructose-bisphosphate aldolase [Phocaeicola plebeius]
MFARAIKGGYAIPAFNFNNMEQLQAIIKAAVETKSPVILQVSKGARNYANQTLLRYMAEGAVEYAKELGCAHPEIVLHLDHGDSFELCKSCIDMGFSSVMIDGSHLPYEENVALTKKVVDYAHQFDVTVEGELGVLAGVEDEVSAEHHTYTNPEEVIDFATRTGCDSLAISIGTSHGAYKFKPEQCHVDPATGRLVPPPLEFAVLDAVMEKLPGFPIVLHGSSSVPQEEVDTINKYGGKLEAAIGIPEDQLRKAAKSAVCKINIDSDSRFAVLDAVMEKLPGFPIVLHGSSSVPQEEVDTINKFGGKLEAAIGIPEEQLRKAAKSAVCKINIDSDSRLAMTAAIRKVFAEKPAEFDPRKYLGPARDNMEKLYKHKIINVLGSDNKLAQC